MSDAVAWPYARVLAHRGGGTLAPENTVAAIAFGYQMGFRAVEFDAMLSHDEVPVLIHDETLQRTTNARGAVADRTAAELTRLDAGAWYGHQFSGEPLPTLDRALRFCREQGIWVNAEIKPSNGAEARTGEVVAAQIARFYADRISFGGGGRHAIVADVPLLSSFSYDALRSARAAAPDLPRGWLTDKIPANWADVLASIDAVSLHCNQRYLTMQRAREIKNAGYWLFCYTVNDPRRAREIMQWGVDAFCTDRIDLIPPDFA